MQLLIQFFASEYRHDHKDWLNWTYACFLICSNLLLDLQMHLIVDLIKEENRIRSEGGLLNSSDIFGQLLQGRRISVKLGGHYPAVILDAKPDAEPPALRCGVFLVPKVLP